MIVQVNDYDSFILSAPSTPEILYQSNPKEYSPDMYKEAKSYTLSLESYQKAAWKEYSRVIDNPRRTEHEIVINYRNEFSIQEIKDQFKLMRKYLQEQGIIAFSVAEISRNKYKTGPVNHLHRHFLVDSDSLDLSEKLLRDIFKGACRYAGLQPDEPNILDSPDAPKKNCEVKYQKIDNNDSKGNTYTPEESFQRRVRYILKYNSYNRTPILFQSKSAYPHLKKGIDKIASIGNWFINPDGTKANKTKMWEKRCIRKHPESAAKELVKEIIQHLPQVTMEYSGSIHIGDQSYHWGN